jgi:hypothetical protein
MDIENIPGIDLESLVGEHVLDAVDTESAQVKTWGDSFESAEVIRFRLDGIVYTAVEDPDDGYRSSMDKIFISDDPMRNVFTPCKVLARMDTEARDYGGKNETLELLDTVTGKVVLRVGTDNSDDYYPWFVAEWIPAAMAANQGEQQ